MNYIEIEVSMNTRELILQRLDEIEKQQVKGFNRHVMRWQRVYLRGILLQDIEFTLLPDDELVEVFEIVLRQYYKQM